MPLGIIAAMNLINLQTDILMLGMFMPVEDVGRYRVAAQTANLVSFGLSSIAVVITPYFARLHASNEMVRFQRLATASARAMLIIALPALPTISNHSSRHHS